MNFLIMILCTLGWGFLMLWLLPSPWCILAAIVGGWCIGGFFGRRA